MFKLLLNIPKSSWRLVIAGLNFLCALSELIGKNYYPAVLWLIIGLYTLELYFYEKKDEENE